MRRFLVPMAGFPLVSGLATLLIWGIVLTSPDTHTHLWETLRPGYDRTAPITVGQEVGDVELTLKRGRAEIGNSMSLTPGQEIYLASGCALCHGLDARGGVVGPDLGDATAAEIRRAISRGPKGMPAFHTQDPTDEQVKLIAKYIGQIQLVAAPMPTPNAEATPMPASTVGPLITPTPTPTPTVGPPVTPTPTPTVRPPGTPGPSPTPPAAATPTPSAPAGPVYLTAARATITVDGNTSDWASIPGTRVTLSQVGPIARVAMALLGYKMGKLAPMVVTLKVAVDSAKVYVLVEAPDDYDWVRGDPYLSGKMSVMFRIDDPAAPHMGATEEEQKKSLGTVDIWHWSLDCGPAEVSGGGGIPGGRDSKCGLDDEWATTPKERKDDNTPQAENSLVGIWEHTGRAGRTGATGTWVFELSRPLRTGDPQDAQLTLGGKAYMALAYWDPDENADGWTEVGHLQSATPHGWIEVTLPQPR